MASRRFRKGSIVVGVAGGSVVLGNGWKEGRNPRQREPMAISGVFPYTLEIPFSSCSFYPSSILFSPTILERLNCLDRLNSSTPSLSPPLSHRYLMARVKSAITQLLRYHIYLCKGCFTRSVSSLIYNLFN